MAHKRILSLLSTYILKEFLSNLFLGVLIFTFVLLLDHLFELVDILINKGGGLWLTARLLAFLIPSTLSITLPIACLLAALLTFGRLSETNEITAIRASGLSAWSYLKTPYCTAVVIMLFLVPFNSCWAPVAQGHFRQLFLEVLGRNPLVQIEENTFLQLGDYHIFVRHKRPHGGIANVSIYKLSENRAPLRIYAKRGITTVNQDRGLTFNLSDGYIDQIDPATPDHYVHTTFDSYTLLIPFGNSASSQGQSLEEMTYFQLRDKIRELQSEHISFPILTCQIQLRWALAFTPLLFVALGIPLAIRVQRGTRATGFAISLVVIAIYYVVLMGGTGLGQRGVWPPVPAVWMANIILTVAAASFTFRFLQF
jgi:lipopolysaccharide export system permease protein